MTSELANKECVPCKGGTPPLPPAQVRTLLGELDDWTIEQEYHLTRSFAFPDFVTALDFVNRVGKIAEQQQHHPDIYLAWGKVRVEVSAEIDFDRFTTNEEVYDPDSQVVRSQQIVEERNESSDADANLSVSAANNLTPVSAPRRPRTVTVPKSFGAAPRPNCPMLVIMRSRAFGTC